MTAEEGKERNLDRRKIFDQLTGNLKKHNRKNQQEINAYPEWLLTIILEEERVIKSSQPLSTEVPLGEFDKPLTTDLESPMKYTKYV